MSSTEQWRLRVPEAANEYYVWPAVHEWFAANRDVCEVFTEMFACRFVLGRLPVRQHVLLLLCCW